jgi:F0F1-type ATP synthase beta subunit
MASSVASRAIVNRAVDGMYDQWEEQAFYLIGDMSTLKESV